MPDVFELLHQDHVKVIGLLAQLRKASPKSPEELRETNRVAQHLVIEESRHEASEEIVLWPSVRLHVPEGDGLADTALDQEQKGKWVLHGLSYRTPENEGFADLVEEFANLSEAHIAFEELEVWPALRSHLKGHQGYKLATKLAKAKASAPTRPHPGAPTDPRKLARVGTLVSAMDRSVDFVTGRGRDQP